MTIDFKTEFANTVSLLIAFFSVFSLSRLYFYDDSSYLEGNVVMIIFQCSYDIFLYHSHDSAIHHCFVLLMSYLFTFDLSEEDFKTIVVPLLATEISTIFMVLRSWFGLLELRGTVLYKLNNLAFVVTFALTRVIGFYFYLIANQKTYDVISFYTADDIYQKLPIYVGLFGLCALNYYWFILILRIGLRCLQAMSPLDYYFTTWFYSIHYYCLLYFYVVGGLTFFSEFYLIVTTTLMFLFFCCQGGSSVHYLVDALNEIYDSNFVRVPILLDAGLVILLSDELSRINLVILCWVMLLTYLMKPFYLLNDALLWGLFIAQTIFLLA